MRSFSSRRHSQKSSFLDLGAVGALRPYKQARRCYQPAPHPTLARYPQKQLHHTSWIQPAIIFYGSGSGHLEEIAILSAVLPEPDCPTRSIRGSWKDLVAIFWDYLAQAPKLAVSLLLLLRKNGERWDVDSYILARTKRGPLFSRTMLKQQHNL
jgi:hypothetical protein